MIWTDIPNETLEILAKKHSNDYSNKDVFTLGVYMLSRFGSPFILTGDTRDDFDAYRIMFLDLRTNSYQINTTIPINGNNRYTKKLNELLKAGINLGERHKLLRWFQNLVEKPDIMELSVDTFDSSDKSFSKEVFYDNIDPYWSTVDQETKNRLWNGKLPWELVFNKGQWLEEMVTTYKKYYDMVKENNA